MYTHTNIIINAHMSKNEKIKKIVIIGGGVSGLSAGIYAQKHGFISEIYEKNPTNGGLCTSWYRKGYKIDGCIHWLTGTKSGTDLNNMWKDVDAFDDDDIIYSDNFGSIEYNGKVITFWSDLDRLEKELIEISPIDKRRIHKLIKYTIKFYKMPLPMEKPLATLNIIDYLKFGFKMIPYLPAFLYACNISQKRFASKFKSEDLKHVLSKIVPGSGNLYTTLYALGTNAFNNGGVPKGGSTSIVKRMEDEYRRLGGSIRNNSEVVDIEIVDKIVKSITLKNGEKVNADYFVSCIDAYELTRKLLKEESKEKKFKKRFVKMDKYPLPSCFYVSFSADVRKLKELNITNTYEFNCEPFEVAKKSEETIKIRDYSYDSSFIKDGRVLLNVLIHQDDRDYYYWEKLHQNYSDYYNVKMKIASLVKSRIEEHFNILKDDLEIIDVATPMTYKRYVNAYRGAYMPFSFTADGKQLLHHSKVKGVHNLILAGQWIIMPGGLPIALMSGKFAIQLISKKEHKSMFLPIYRFHFK